MESTRCPHCEHRSNITYRWGQVHPDRASVSVAATCDHCDALLVGRTILNKPYNQATQDVTFVQDAINQGHAGFQWWPRSGESPSIPDVPDHIERAAKEAHTSASIGNHMAAILMARTTIEATAKANGVSTGNLKSKIDKMAESSLIRSGIAQQAHVIRLEGNDMAHGDLDVSPDEIDSEEILFLMDEVLHDVFQSPARFARGNARRDARSSP
jgi:Domain of unknown function (DUF4145)